MAPVKPDLSPIAPSIFQSSGSDHSLTLVAEHFVHVVVDERRYEGEVAALQESLVARGVLIALIHRQIQHLEDLRHDWQKHRLQERNDLLLQETNAKHAHLNLPD